MTSEVYYSQPPIISEATPTQCAELAPYTYNKQEVDPPVRYTSLY